MRVLLDTKVLTRMAEPGHSQYQVALDATDVLGKQGHELVLVPQVVYEFWVVCTRPKQQNGLGRTATETERELASIKSLFSIVGDTDLIFQAWETLVTTAQIVGKNAHDARLVAAMEVSKITHLLTFNDKDFNRFHGITVLKPNAIAGPPVTP